MSSRAKALVLVLATVLVAPGCRALGVRPYSPGPVATTPSLTVAELVSQHNRNAELVLSLEASPSISDRKIGAGQGKMALVRPRDFKMTVSHPGRGVIADVGSNDQEFWIWSAQSEEKAVFVGQYDAGGELPPELLFQPDWVVEALGLRLIPPEEARAITIQKGDAAGSMVLVHNRTNAKGDRLVKKTLVDRATGQIREHGFYGPDGRTLVARALPEEYEAVSLESGERVLLPNRIRLIVQPPGQEPLALSFVLGVSSVKVNQFDPSRRAAIFQVPEYEGYKVVNLNEQLAPGASGRTARSYSTLPAPGGPGTAQAVVELGAPVAAGPGIESPSPVPGDPVPLEADLPGPTSERPPTGVIGARMPRPPGSIDTMVQPIEGVGIGQRIPPQ